MEILRFDKVSFSYKPETPLVTNCSFHIQKGEKVVIQGKSGSGKSTIFRLILGFEIPVAGAVYYQQKRLTPLISKQLREQTAWLPQELNLGEGKVGDAIGFLLQFKKNRRLKTKSAVTELFSTMGLNEDLLNQNVVELSTGQRQRVGLVICSLLNRPFLLLDEPTSALDQTAKKQVADLLLTDPEKTVISISHDTWWQERCATTLHTGE